jgi:translation elongation factor P/translation initiation factor 5A
LPRKIQILDENGENIVLMTNEDDDSDDSDDEDREFTVIVEDDEGEG